MRHIPNVLGDKTYMDIYTRLLEDRIIYLASDIDDAVASNIVAQLLYLDSVDTQKNIYLYINSPGGSVSAGLSIYDTINLIDAPVSTVAFGTAASMGAFLLACGEKGKRYILPSCKLMIHQPLGGAMGQATDVQIQVNEMMRVKKYLNTILAEKTGKDIAQITQDTERDNYMTAEECVAYGIADQVLIKKVAVSN